MGAPTSAAQAANSSGIADGRYPSGLAGRLCRGTWPAARGAPGGRTAQAADYLGIVTMRK
jgi:hypothetical protein